MHGVKRAHQSAEALKARRLREHAKLQEYLTLTDEVLKKKKAHDFTNDALALTTRLLTVNPEFYSVWNYRRDILSQGTFPKCTTNEIMELLLSDLDMTMSFLRVHPKVYCIWNHRRWCLEIVPDGWNEPKGDHKQQLWAKELSVVERLLDADARNFQAWDYRRYVLASMPMKKAESDELAYTTRKIEANFSNFSAWHQRSKVFASLWESGHVDQKSSKDEEFELVKQALYVDPYDQSGWIYHRWLIGDGGEVEILRREIKVVEELLDVEPNCKWCLESLAHYNRLLISMADEEERKNLIESCRTLLTRLQDIDPYRSRRYADLGAQLVNESTDL